MSEIENPEHYQPDQDTRNIKVGALDLKTTLRNDKASSNRFSYFGEQASGGLKASFAGVLSEDAVILRHIELDRELRGKGVGAALLHDLEQRLEQQGVKDFYAGFFNPKTVDFLLRNGYKIIPFTAMDDELKTRLGIDSKDFDFRVVDQDVFDRLKTVEPDKFKKILLRRS